jgi:hypothetical protein
MLIQYNILRLPLQYKQEYSGAGVYKSDGGGSEGIEGSGCAWRWFISVAGD